MDDSIKFDTQADRKTRWGGFLENPFISNFQRGMLDSGRLSGLKKALRLYAFRNVLDVGCGFGESSKIHTGMFFGLDNSIRRISYATQKYKEAYFLLGDAHYLPVKSKSFDMVILSNTSHHLSDDQFKKVFSEMKRVSSRYIIINDAVIREDQGRIRSFFYQLDRGGHYRKTEYLRQIILSEGRESVSIEKEACFWTFPGIYYRTVFICKIQ